MLFCPQYTLGSSSYTSRQEHSSHCQMLEVQINVENNKYFVCLVHVLAWFNCPNRSQCPTFPKDVNIGPPSGYCLRNFLHPLKRRLHKKPHIYWRKCNIIFWIVAPGLRNQKKFSRWLLSRTEEIGVIFDNNFKFWARHPAFGWYDEEFALLL